MGVIEKPNTFSAGAVVVASEHNANFDTIYTEFNGEITGANIDIISTAGKVSGAALTGLANIPAGAGVIPAANVGNTFPSGGIIMWSGSIATIPTGWVLCDGSNSTPDLRDKFIVGAKQDDSGTAKTNITGSLTQTGGAATKDLSHTHTTPNHTHTLADGGASSYNSIGYDIIKGGSNRIATGVGDGGSYQYASYVTDSGGSGTSGSGGSSTQDILNPYYALAFIMKT